MRSLLRSLVALFGVGVAVAGCTQPAPQPPPVPTDMTLHVPGMH